MAAFVPDVAGIRALEVTPGLAVAVVKIGNDIRRAAVANALPRRHHRYRNAFAVDAGLAGGTVIARISNDDFTAGWVEFGAHAGGKTRVLGYHVMTRAMEAVAALNR